MTDPMKAIESAKQRARYAVRDDIDRRELARDVLALAKIAELAYYLDHPQAMRDLLAAFASERRDANLPPPA